MNLVDVNILIYAFDATSPSHRRARDWIDVHRRRHQLALCDPITSGFLRLVTNPRVFGKGATTTSTAARFVDGLGARHLAGGAAVLEEVIRLARDDRAIRANLVPDTWIAATALVHGARVATADAGFARYAGLQLINPLDVA